MTIPPKVMHVIFRCAAGVCGIIKESIPVYDVAIRIKSYNKRVIIGNALRLCRYGISNLSLFKTRKQIRQPSSANNFFYTGCMPFVKFIIISYRSIS